ncbi:hypothetical protein FZC33_18935 [Labrys sp. KNU-23]|uniref:hypothetical protein n=1 Tax=Labrys sp. KNU-23 TaxID=2789216 RepID=UPI0011ED39DB|nr:hypothetical protein [Labrys sp. KNU-23]QEN88253.1 hypothetical protein FZC33_18935 [Labrys sp. KNU-23]
MRHIPAAALVALVAGPATAQERPEDYMTFSCTHLPAMKVTQQLVALYGDKGDKLVVASDLENYLALVSLDNVARLRKDGKAYEKFFPARNVGGKREAPVTLQYHLEKDETSGKQRLKVTNSGNGTKVMDCTPVPK